MHKGRRKSSVGPTPSPVRVAVRIRPQTSCHERDAADESASSLEQPSTLLQQCVSPGSSSPTAKGCNALQFHHDNQAKTFTFDHVFTPDSTQKDVYSTALQPLLTPFLNGFNVTVLAYGQTGSGKTYTVGNRTSNTPVASPARPNEPGGGRNEPKPHTIGDEDGLLPRFLCDLFAALRKEPSVKTIHVSFLEIYCDEVRDLLQQQARSQHHHQHQTKDNQLSIREDEHKVWVENLRQLQVENVQKALELMNLGRSRQVVAHNAINDMSSRSHAIYTLEVARKFVNEIKKTKLTFVDLAGSERLKKTQVEGVRMKESIQINVGLLALGNVINALGDDKSQKRRNSLEGIEAVASAPFVPYRSSKLTRLLRDSLGGNSMTLFIACVSPSKIHGSETLNTLQYANRARNIQNKAEKNVESLDSGGSSPRNSSSPRNGKRLQRTASEIEIHSLQEQICFLKQQLDQANAAAASANVVGTNIPSSSLQVQILPLHTKKNNDVRTTERVALIKESDAVTSAADDALGLQLPVIPVTTKTSGIKPPSRSKLTLPISPKATARASIASAGIAANGVTELKVTVDAVTIQTEYPDAPAAVAALVTAIESTCRSPSASQNDEITASNAEVISLEPDATKIPTETDSDSQLPVTTREETLEVKESDQIVYTSTEQRDRDPPITCATPSESVEQDATSPYYTASFQEAPSGNGQHISNVDAEAGDGDTGSPTSASSPKSIESSQVKPTFERCENPETEVSPASESDEGKSQDGVAMDRNCCEPVVQTVDEIAGSEVKTQENVLRGTPCPEICEQVPATQREIVSEPWICDDEPHQPNSKHLDDFVTRAWRDPENGDYDPLVDEATTFSIVGPMPESDSDDELSSSFCISPETSPVSRCATICFVAENVLEVSSHESENWKLVSSGGSFSGGEAGNQEPRDEAATTKGDSVPSKKSESQISIETEPAVEIVPAPDFVLRRPPPCQTLMSPRAHRRGRLSPQKHPLRPMSVFDFDDSWEKLQRSRPPSSVSRLESLVKSIKQLITDEFRDSSNQDETEVEEEEETHQTSPTSAADRCLDAMTSYFAKRRKAQRRIGKLKQKLLEFEALLGLPGPIYDECELRAFVVSRQEVFLQQRVDFYEAIAAQRVFRRLQSRREANTELFNLNSNSVEDIFLSNDQFKACEEWLESKLFDRTYFQRHVLPLVLNGWIAVTPTNLEKEDAWLAL